MARKHQSFPPFPPLQWDGYFWVGEVVLRSWAGFQSRRGPYGSTSPRTPSDGSARLVVATADAGTPLSAEQAAAFRFLLAEEKVITDVVLHDVFGEYPTWKWEYADATEEEADEVMPDLETP